MFTLQGKRGPPGNIGKSGPMVSRNMLCFTFVSLLCTKKTSMTFWKSKLDAKVKLRKIYLGCNHQSYFKHVYVLLQINICELAT